MFWIWKTNGGSPHNERKTGEDESKDCFCVRHDSSTRYWTRHLCARSTARTNKMLIPQDHEKRQTLATRHGNGDRTTSQDFVPVGSGWSVQNPIGTEGKCWNEVYFSPSVEEELLERIECVEMTLILVRLFWMSVIQLLFKGRTLSVQGSYPCILFKNLTPLFDEYRTDTDKQIKQHALLRVSLQLNQSNPSCTEPVSLANTFDKKKGNR